MLNKVKWGLLAGIIAQVIISLVPGFPIPEEQLTALLVQLIQLIFNALPVAAFAYTSWRIPESERKIRGLKLIA